MPRTCCALALALLALACTAPARPGADPDPAPPRPGEPPPSEGADAPGAAKPGRSGARAPTAGTSRADVARRWGLDLVPLRPPAPPGPDERVPLVGAGGLPPVFVSVPTEDRVVFLTIDDGSEHDPRVPDMLRELEIPFTAFLADRLVDGGYDYFREAYEQGVAIQNHTVGHPEMPLLSYAEQRAEICRQQEVLVREFGERPTLFRPPYGAYDADTLRAAAACGVDGVPLWTQEAFSDRVEWARPDGRFHPGDIILSHFRGEGDWAGDASGDMVDMLRRIVDEVTEQGFAIARLEDYV
ncbi:polysaccharide deacetylase family protein [Streptomyces sp. B6B3]|uniref:polysaccharide deacetylase family protein n=1 Tax=Streptomyces sp. B6B3 TaxID=3153570 RepID=UPI00325D2D55